MRSLLFLCCYFLPFLGSGQLNCQTKKGIKGDSIICFHQNGLVSSISYSSINHERYYHFLAFDNKGNKVLEANHGLLHGSAGLDVTYYPNGAIQSARKTFQPDGGIQHYDATSFYNEDGTFNHEEDNSWDRQTTIITQPLEKTPLKKASTEVKIDSVIVVLSNKTNKKLKILVGEIDAKSEKQIITVKKNSEVEIGKFLPTNKMKGALQFYQIEVLPRKKPMKTVMILNDELNSQLRHVIFIFKKEEK